MKTVRRLDKLRARLASLRFACGRTNHTIIVAGDSLCTGRAPGMLALRLRNAGTDVGVMAVARGGILIDELAPMLAGCTPRHGPGSVVGVIILVGGNHAKEGQEATEETLTASLRRCLDIAATRWPASFVVLCTVPIPSSHPALRPDTRTVMSNVINPTIRTIAVARGTLLCELETVFDGMSGARSDGVHPTTCGDRLLADRWFQAVWPWFLHIAAT